MATTHSTSVVPRSSSPLLSIGEAALQLGVHVNTLREWSNSGEFPTVILPSGYRRYRMEDINVYLGFDAEGDSEAAEGIPVAILGPCQHRCSSPVSNQGSNRKRLREAD